MPYERRSYGLQWVDEVPRIPPIITNSIVYLYQDKDSADAGIDAGASGFLLDEQSAASSNVRPIVRQDPSMISKMREQHFADAKAALELFNKDRGAANSLITFRDVSEHHLKHCHHIYVVTNKHVIAGDFPCPVVRMNLKHPGSGFERTYVIPFNQSDWVIDPNNDLAVCMLPPDFNPAIVNFSVISRSAVMSEKDFREQDIGPGDEVFYVGRFMGHAGRYENMPSVRFGNISMNPNEREPIAWETKTRHHEQVGFLVEARSRSGYSGSPVFFLNQHAVNNRRAVFPMLDVRLLGIDWGHLPEKIKLTTQGNPTVWQAEIHAGMMGVVPSWCLLDFIDTAPRLIQQRERDDDLYMELSDSIAKGIPDVLSDEDA